MFIKDVSKKDIEAKTGISYTAICNYLVRHSGMTIVNLEKVFKALDFPLVEALKLTEKDLTRVELIKSILNEVQNDK